MNNPLEFLSPTEGEPPHAETPPASEPTVETVAPQASPESLTRGPDGKFAAKTVETADDKPVTEPGEVEKPLTQRELNGLLGKAMDERDKRQALEREAIDLKRQIADLQAQATPQTVSAEQRMMAEMQALRVEQQRVRSDIKHGADNVQAAFDWAFKRCDEDKVFNSRVTSMLQIMENPYEVAIELRKEADALDALKNPSQPEPEPSPPPPPAAEPPRSLVTARGNGAAGKAHVPIGEGNAYASVIN